jgi:Spy/CpxP family protein refolding chaperone
MTTAKSPLKMRPMSALAATVVLALAASLAPMAHAGPHGGRGGPGDGPGGFAGPGMMFAQPQHIERMLDSVNASTEQRTQIRQILQAARTDLQPLRETGRKLQDQGLALLAAPTVDARAADALRQQMLAQHDQASKRELQALLDVSRVLTAEQRKTIADRAAQRRALFERHRAEREAIDPPPRH